MYKSQPLLKESGWLINHILNTRMFKCNKMDFSGVSVSELEMNCVKPLVDRIVIIGNGKFLVLKEVRYP